MASEKKVAILGCGWLGLPLGKELIRHRFEVHGSTTSGEKLPVLAAEGILPFLVQVTPEGVRGEIEEFLAGVDILVVDFPPGLKKDPNLNFSGAINKLKQVIEAAGVKKVLFISSISVYSGTESFTIYTEGTAPNARSHSANELISAENIMSKNTTFQCTLLRFGGLFGAGRHPVNHLAGRKNISNPLGPVNLIHLVDCIGIILKILEMDRFGEVYNAVYPINPPREEYYKKCAKDLSLVAPVFDHDHPSIGKIISASKIVRELGYEFQERI